MPRRDSPQFEIRSKSDATHKAVQATLDGVTSNPETGVAGLVFAAINKDGDILTANASGNRGLETKEPMTLETTFWIASCTKMITAIAVMQLVEQGKLDLDDHKQLYKLCPELEKVQVLTDDGKLEDKEAEITMRMLLSHTAGFGYEFFNTKLRNYGRPVGFDVFSGDPAEVLKMPLVNQPGSRWEYGINIDWAGIALERLTGMTLNDYMQQNILQPLGIHNTNMFPTKEMKSNLASMHQRWPGSPQKAVERDHVYRRPMVAEGKEEQSKILCSGGAGLFSRPTEYIKVLAVLLNDGTCPKMNKQILKPETVKQMFENQITQMPDFGRRGIPDAKPEHSNPLGDLYPQGDVAQGWCLSAMLTIEPGVTGRGKNTAFWAGIANLFWWVDREKGVAGMIASQVMPFGDPNVMGAWFGAETAVYDNLGASK